MYDLSNITKTTKEQYNKINNNYYNAVRSVSISNFQPNGKKNGFISINTFNKRNI